MSACDDLAPITLDAADATASKADEPYPAADVGGRGSEPEHTAADEAEDPAAPSEESRTPATDGAAEREEGAQGAALASETVTVEDAPDPVVAEESPAPATSVAAGGRAAPETPTLDGVEFDGPLVITKGGTYRGQWQSMDPDTAAVSIATREPVVIENSTIRSRGHLIRSSVDRTDVTVRDTTAVALNPGRPRTRVGRFALLLGARRAHIERNSVFNTSGIAFGRYGGNGSGADEFRVIANRVVNIDGRLSTGDGFSTNDDSAWLAQFVSLSEMRDVPGVEIAWNHVTNEPGRSRVEDVVSVYLSNGSPADPILIHDNFIDGAYPTNPSYDDFNGGGIMLGDGRASEYAVRDVIAEHNVVVNTTNHGMAISAGERVTMRDNRVLSTGRLPDGSVVAAQNVGIYVWNYHGQSAFSNNDATENVVGWENVERGEQFNFYLPDVDDASGNVSFGQRVTDAALDREFGSWNERAASAGARIGAH